MATFTALFDACVLYSAPLTDLLMQLAVEDLFSARWTDLIHEEWMGKLLENRPDLDRQALERRRALMDAHQHPDTFAHHLIDLAPAKVCAAVRRQRANLKNPPLTVPDLLDVLARQRLPEFVSRLSDYRELL